MTKSRQGLLALLHSLDERGYILWPERSQANLNVPLAHEVHRHLLSDRYQHANDSLIGTAVERTTAKVHSLSKSLHPTDN